MRRRLAVALGLLVTSCVQVEGFDPVGDVAAVAGRWQIDSATPTSSLCETLGADRVQLTFLDGRRPVSHTGLFFRCDQGDFTTVGAGGAVIGAGRWTVRLDAIDSSGALVAVGPCQEVEVSSECPDAGTPLVTASANFLTATISAGFRIASQDPTQARCDAAGISEVALVFEDLGGGIVIPTGQACGVAGGNGCGGATDAGVGVDAGLPALTGSSSEPCAAGFVGARVAPGHTYRVRVRATDAAGATVRETEARDVSVTAGQHLELDSAGIIELGP